MREKLLDRGADALADYELLEMLLFLGIDRVDTKPLAKTLLNQFGSLDGVLAASAGELQAAGLTGRVQSLFNTVSAASRRLTAEEAEERPYLRDIAAITDYLRQPGSMAPGWAALHTNSRNRLLLDQRLPAAIAPGDLARTIAAEALRQHGSAVVLVALRDGPPRPGKADREAAHACRDACRALSVTLHDVLVLSPDGEASLRQEGLL